MRVGIVGLGTIGRVHAAALAALGADVVALCDIRPERAEAINEKYGFSATVFGDYEKMLADASLDAVHICTPHYLHASEVIAALDLGVNVLCEKPLCITTKEISDIRRAVARSTATLGVCHQNRYNKTTQYLKEYLADKRVVGAHASVAWHRDAAYYGQDVWRGKWDTEGGGVMINQALHTLDLLAYLVGKPQRVRAAVHNFTLQGVTEVEDTATAVFEGDGVHFTFFATLGAAADLPVTVQLKLDNGEKILLMPHALLIGSRTVDLTQAPTAPTVGKECYGSGHERLIDDFYRCLRTGTPFGINAEEGLFTVEMILAMYRSEGKRVDIK